MFKNYPFYISFSFFLRNHFPHSEKNVSLLKNWYYEKCIKFPVYYSKKAIPFSLSRVWLDASKILSKTKANSGKIQLELAAAEVVQTLE